MKKINLNTLGFIVLLNFIFVPSNAQLKDAGVIMGAGIEDGKAIMSSYLAPFSKALGGNLSTGWYNTAKAHKALGFDVTFSGSFAFIPPNERDFNLDNLDLNADYSDNMAPSIAGKAQKGPELSYDGENIKFNTPKGTGVPVMFSPMVKAGVGLPKGTELMGKYAPAIELGNKGEVGLWGVGFKHDVMQHLGLVDKLPFLNVSVMAAYSQMKSSVGLSVKPDDIGLTNSTDSDFDNQQLEFKVDNLTSSLLVSADLPVIAFYGGVGLSSTTGNLKLAGDYPVPDDNGDLKVEKDIEMDIEDEDGNVKPRLNIGAKLTFAVVTFHVDYTKTDYSFVSTGLGISFR